MKNKLDFVLLYTQLKYGVRLYSYFVAKYLLVVWCKKQIWTVVGMQWVHTMVQIRVVIFESGRHQYSWLPIVDCLLRGLLYTCQRFLR